MASRQCQMRQRRQEIVSNPQRESQQVWLERENRGTSQKEVEETLENILKEELQVWLVRGIWPSQGTLNLTQVGWIQSTW